MALTLEKFIENQQRQVAINRWAEKQRKEAFREKLLARRDRQKRDAERYEMEIGASRLYQPLHDQMA